MPLSLCVLPSPPLRGSIDWVEAEQSFVPQIPMVDLNVSNALATSVVLVCIVPLYVP